MYLLVSTFLGPCRREVMGKGHTCQRDCEQRECAMILDYMVSPSDGNGQSAVCRGSTSHQPHASHGGGPSTGADRC